MKRIENKIIRRGAKVTASSSPKPPDKVRGIDRQQGDLISFLDTTQMEQKTKKL
jgi:hypothetical protein